MKMENGDEYNFNQWAMFETLYASDAEEAFITLKASVDILSNIFEKYHRKKTR